MRAGGKIQTGSVESGNRLPLLVLCYEWWEKTLRGSTGIAALLSFFGDGACEASELCYRGADKSLA